MILNYQATLQHYQHKRASYDKTANALRHTGDKTPLLSTPQIINQTENDQRELTDIDSAEPEKIAEFYEKISRETNVAQATTLTADYTICSYANRRAFNNRKKELLEAAEQLKTAILQALLFNLLKKLMLNEEIANLQSSPSFWNKTASHGFAWSNIIYGLFKGYSGVAAAFALAMNVNNPISIACSGTSALLFGAMSYLFEGQEIYKANRLTGNSRSVNKHIGEQYQLAADMSNFILEKTLKSQPVLAPATNVVAMPPLKKIQSYHNALTRITACDLSKKIETATTYSDRVNKSKTHQRIMTGMGVVLATLNGFAYGFVGISTATLILKCSALALLLGGLFVATSGGIWAVMAMLFIAGFTSAWYAKKFGPSFVQATLQQPALLTIAKVENEERKTNSLQEKSRRISQFFELQKVTAEKTALEAEVHQLPKKTA